MENIYLYLVRRNKKDTKIIGVLQSEIDIKSIRLNDIDLLGLSAHKRFNIKNIIEIHKLDWEVWLEGAQNYNVLRQNLLNRGIVAASSPNTPLVDMDLQIIPKSTVIKLNKNKIMTRRG